MISETSEVTESTAHTVLNYCITQAIVSNKSLKTKIQIPYENLARSSGMDETGFPGTALEVEMTFNWVEHSNDDLVEVESED